jgi:hypothetical protein
VKSVQLRKPYDTPSPRRGRRIAAIAGIVLFAVLPAVLLAVALGFWLWATLSAAGPDATALAALEDSAAVTVSEDPWLTFTPTGAEAPPKPCGLVFYPGGLVDARAYAPTLQPIAAAGYTVVAPSMPLGLAVLAPDRATAAMAAHPEIARWAVGGHSLGGAMAARHAFTHPDGAADGLALWAAFPAESNSLAGRDDLAAASIYGTLDGLATVEEIEQSRALLPAATEFVAIEGGNHAQFGSYGPQRRDNPAAIPAAEQQAQAAAATVALLDALCR